MAFYGTFGLTASDRHAEAFEAAGKLMGGATGVRNREGAARP